MSELKASIIKSHPEYVAVVNELVLNNVRMAEINAKIIEKDARIAELERNLNIFKKQLFASKSEKLRTVLTSNAQESLFSPREIPVTAVEEVVEVEIPSYKRRMRKRYTDKLGNLSHFPAELERKETVLEPEGLKTCESCGKDKIKIDQVVTEKLQVIPCQYYVERFVRPVMGCSCKDCIPAKAESPEELLPKSILGQSFIALSLTQKFAWHLPFYRQSQMLAQVGIEIDSNVLINTALKVAKQLYLMAAVSYVLNHWEGLTAYLENGIIPISNIKVEQQIRNLKLGAKNWLFASSEIGAEAVAIFNSLVCTCKMNNINILDYFGDILGRITTDSASKLTPLAWEKERKEKIAINTDF